MEKIQSWLGQLQWGNLLEPAVLILAYLLCITVHETCHGLAAYALGDPTAKRAGRLSLNPLRHVDLLGLIMMAIFRFGWAKPVPIDPRYFKKPKRDMALTALAGPVSNVLLAWIAVICYAMAIFFYRRSSAESLSYVCLFFQYMAILSAGLAVFNLIPIPPLDGSKVLFSLFSDKVYAKVLRYERYGMVILFVVLYLGWLDKPLEFLRGGLLTGLEAVGLWPYTLLQKIFS